jgi:hypothetical protein
MFVTLQVQVPTHVGDPKTWASKALVLGYAFLALIMVRHATSGTEFCMPSNTFCGRYCACERLC